MNCELSVFLAYGMAIYVFASIFYLIFTHNVGTPFKDSLTQRQLNIKKQAVTQRGKIFCYGITTGLIVFLLWRPFRLC